MPVDYSGGVPLDEPRARELAEAGQKATDWRAKRDQLIREAARDGASLREIAGAVGLSNPAVHYIVRMRTDGTIVDAKFMRVADGKLKVIPEGERLLPEDDGITGVEPGDAAQQT